MPKKIYALIAEVREQECDHLMLHWTGQIPCTGQLVCYMCGTDFTP